MAIKEIHLRVPSTCRPRNGRECDKSEITESIEEYVEGIWRLEREVQTVGTGEVAQYMSVTPASATTMLKRLAALGLVEHVPYQGVKCSEKGEALAVDLLRKHRLLERLLVDFLGLPWDGVHDLACKLEHYVSMEVADRIEHALDGPATCPHGNPVDAMVEDHSIRLSDASDDSPLTVTKITDEREEFLSYVYQVGLLPGTTIRVTERSPFGDVLMLEVEGRDRLFAIGKEVSNSVYVHSNSIHQTSCQ